MAPGTPITPNRQATGGLHPAQAGFPGAVHPPAPTSRASDSRRSALDRGFLGELRIGELTALHWALAALVLISIGRVHDHIGILGVLRPGLTLTAFCMLIALVKPASLRFDNIFAAWPGKAMIALGGASILSSFFGLSLGASGGFLLQTMAPVMVLFFLTTVCFRNPNDLRWVAIAYVAANIGVVWASIFLSDTLYFGGYTRQGGAGMYDGNDIGVVYMVGLPLTLVLLRSRSRMLQVLGMTTMLGILASLVLTASRGGFLGLVIGGLAMVLLSPGWGPIQKTLIVAVPALGMVLFAPDGYWDQMGTILNPQDDYNLTSDTGRMAIWARGLGYVAQYPVFGLGPDNFIRAGWFVSDIGRAGLIGASLRDQAPHNTFLQVWAELGSVGFGIWLSILAYGVVAPLRLRRRMPRWWLDQGSSDQRFLYLMASYLPASFVGFAVTTLFVSHAYTPIFYSLVAILAGVIVVGGLTLKQGRGNLGPSRYEFGFQGNHGSGSVRKTSSAKSGTEWNGVRGDHKNPTRARLPAGPHGGSESSVPR